MPDLQRIGRICGLLTLLSAFGIAITVGAAGLTIALCKLVL